MSQKELLGKYSMDTIASCAFGVDSQAFTNKGLTYIHEFSEYEFTKFFHQLTMSKTQYD